MTAITIIMPTYNQSEFIREALDSVRAQSFQDYELIVVNDGSTDTTAEILESYRDLPLTVITHEQNKGLLESVKVALSKAQGRYIARLDSDDIWLPQRLEKGYDFLENHPDCQLVGSSWVEIDRNGKRITNHAFYPGIAHEQFVIYRNPIGCHSTHLVRKTFYIPAFERIYALQQPYAHDYGMILEAVREKGLASLDETLVKYRSHLQSISQKNQEEQQVSHAQYAYHYLQDLGYQVPYSTLEDMIVFINIGDPARYQRVRLDIQALRDALPDTLRLETGLFLMLNAFKNISYSGYACSCFTLSKQLLSFSETLKVGAKVCALIFYRMKQTLLKGLGARP